MTVTQLSVYIENKPGKLAEVISRLSAAEINIRALSLADTSDFGLVRLIVSDAEKAKKQPLNAYVVMQVNDIAKAEEILQKNNIGTLCDADLLESLN